MYVEKINITIAQNQDACKKYLYPVMSRWWSNITHVGIKSPYNLSKSSLLDNTLPRTLAAFPCGTLITSMTCICRAGPGVTPVQVFLQPLFFFWATITCSYGYWFCHDAPAFVHIFSSCYPNETIFLQPLFPNHSQSKLNFSIVSFSFYKLNIHRCIFKLIKYYGH